MKKTMKARAPSPLENATPAPMGRHNEAAIQGGRVSVNKAYKMFVGGAFVRSESGRYFQVTSSPGSGADPETVNVPRGSRKDVRDAVLAAKNAQVGWSQRSAYNRGQIAYRLAEVLESRRAELVHSLARAGASAEEASREVDAAVDRVVYYAGFADKFQALLASSNPVAGPHFGFSVPEPTGVVGIAVPEHPQLLGLASVILPIVVSGNACVAVVGQTDPRTAVLFCECLATSDLPAGVVNVLTGHVPELAVQLAKHREVAALDIWTEDAPTAAACEREGSDNVKRVKTRAPFDLFDEQAGQGLSWIERFVETKTVWHPVGV